MDDFYRGVEMSLLAMSFMLVAAVAALSSPIIARSTGLALGAGIEVTLPMIVIDGDRAVGHFAEPSPE